MIVTPVLVWAVCLGCGLALERVLRVRLSNGLVLTLGLCVVYVLIMPGYTAGAGDVLAIALLAAVTLAGLVFARDGLRARLNPGWAGIAGLAAYVIYMLPVIAYGHWTWSGYDFVNDSAFEMLLANHIKGFGTTLGHISESSERQFLVQYLNNGYPLGTQALLGTFSGVINTSVAILYQSYISSLVAIGAVALCTIAERRVAGWRAAAVALAAICANLTYQYALQGAVKEIGLLAVLCAAAALACEAVSLRRPYTGGALVAVAAAAALATYNAVALPFLGALVLFVGVALVLVRRSWPKPRWILPLAAGGALTALLAIPSLTSFTTFLSAAENGQGATGVGATQFGQLLRKLPVSQLSGVWLTGEYRLPVPGGLAGTLTALASAAIVVLLVVSLLWALLVKDTGVLLMLGVVVLVMLIAFPRASPYAQGKLLAIGGPSVVFVALMVLAGTRGRLAAPALALGGALALAILASDGFAYGHDRVAPTARMEAISQVGKHFEGQGLVLWNEFEEYAKYLANNARISAPFEAITPQQVQLRNPTYFYGHYFDLDEELLSFVEGYPIIVTRRSPAASRPPANYRLDYENKYYLGWRRTSAPQVLRHLPEQQLYSPSATVTCSALAPIVSGAPAGTELVLATAPEVASFDVLSDPRRSGGWVPDPAQAGAVTTVTAGQAEGTLTVAGGARYAVWVQGDFPRKVYVQVDGDVVGWVAGSNTPGQWLQAASLRLSAGSHRVRIYAVGGHRHFGPGEWPKGDAGTIGAVALQREAPERMRTVPLADWRSLCGTQADWVELVRP
ncbi:MAG TPA: hypothetical protein VGX72_13410 [Solirubrobacteraceae bacterium]|nr:hypothetical protein [Solirubrobacteraceae bacterium]